MTSERPYQRLIAWKEAYALAVWVYQATANFPQSEKFALASQMRRAAYGIPTNIAEGNTKRSAADKARFFEIALGSLNELHCELLLSRDLSYLSPGKFESGQIHIRKVSYLLTRLIASVRSRITPRTPRSL